MDKRYTTLYVFICSLFLLLTAMNMLTPESVQDDFVYKFMWKDVNSPNHRLIDSVSDVITSQYYHYFQQNGRVVTHFLLQFFDGVTGKFVFNIANSLVFCCLILLISKIGTNTVNFFYCSIISLLLFLFSPVLKETVLWFAGSFNYLWSMTFAMLFLWVFQRLVSEEGGIGKLIIYISPLSLLLGWNNEASVLPVGILCVLYVLFTIVVMRRRIKVAVFMVLFFFIVGILLSVFSPSTLGKVRHGDSIPILATIQSRLVVLGVVLTELRLFWLYVVLLIVSYKAGRLNMFSKKDFTFWILFLPFVSLSVFLLSGFHYSRMRFPTEVFSILSFVVLMNQYDFSSRFGWLSKICITFIAAFSLPLLYFSYQNYQNYLFCIGQLKEEGRELILTKPDKTPMFLNDYIMKHVDYGKKDVWYFACKKVDSVAPYFGKKEVKYFPEVLYTDIQNNPHLYHTLHTVGDCGLYVVRVSDTTKIQSPEYVFRKTLSSEIPFVIRPIASKIERYSLLRQAPRFFTTFEINSNKYLVMCKPFSGLERRIESVIIK